MLVKFFIKYFSIPPVLKFTNLPISTLNIWEYTYVCLNNSQQITTNEM